VRPVTIRPPAGDGRTRAKWFAREWVTARRFLTHLRANRALVDARTRLPMTSGG
jgi:hypothetical protein